MPRRDDDELDDDRPRPRRRPRDDDDDDGLAKPRRSRDDDYDREPPPKKKGNGLLIGILVGVFVVCCGGGGTAAFFIFRGAKKAVEKFEDTVQGFSEAEQSRQNLTLIGAAAHRFEGANGALPNNSYEVRPKGARPLLSWRVHLLPYLGEDALYREFKLDQPWDSPENSRLLTRMPPVYGSAEARKVAGPSKTFYRGFSSPRGIFEKPRNPGEQPPKIVIASITDGTSNTILIVDAGQAVEWTKPDDLDFSPGQPRPTFGGAYSNVPYAMVVMCDGSLHKLRKDVADNTLRFLIGRDEGNVIPFGWEQP